MAKQITLKFVTGPALNLFGTGADAAGDPPNRLVVCKWGESQTDEGPIYVNENTIKSMAALNQHPYDELVLDFEHSTERDDVPHPKPTAATRCKVGCFAGEGIVYSDMQWTPDGDRAWRSKAYPDLSPAIALNSKREVIFCKSAALCTNGRIKGLHLFSALTLTTPEPDPMDYKKLLVTVLIALGATLTPESDDAAIAAEAERLGKKPETEKEPEVTSMSAKTLTPVEAFAARLDKIEADAVAGRKKAAVEAATAAGKVIAFSDAEIADIPEAILYSHIAKLTPSKVPTDSKTGHAQPGKDLNLSVDAEEEAAIKVFSAQLGVDDADIKKFAATK